MQRILIVIVLMWFFVALQTGDINRDGIVNFKDYALLLQSESGGPNRFDIYELRLMSKTWLMEVEQ